jgi:hypothetical protein
MNFDEIQCGYYDTEDHPKLTHFSITISNNNMLGIQACEVVAIAAPFITVS